MATTKRQNFNITPEQEAGIAQLKELIDSPTTKDAILSAVRVLTVLAKELKEGRQIYMAAEGSAKMHKLLIPEIEVLKPPRYKYLVERPHEWRCQLYVKGRRLPAASVYRDYLLEGRTIDELADDWELPAAAVEECIRYGEENQALFQMEAEEEAKLSEIMTSFGVSEKSELVKQLIHERWLTLQPGKTFLERRGKPPAFLLSGPKNLSSRNERKKRVEDVLRQRALRRAK